jgi:hypothetical protein
MSYDDPPDVITMHYLLTWHTSNTREALCGKLMFLTQYIEDYEHDTISVSTLNELGCTLDAYCSRRDLQACSACENHPMKDLLWLKETDL